MRYFGTIHNLKTKQDIAGRQHIKSIGYSGSCRCPVCGCVGTGQLAIDRHIIRQRDDAHFKLRDISLKRLGVR